MPIRQYPAIRIKGLSKLILNFSLSKDSELAEFRESGSCRRKQREALIWPRRANGTTRRAEGWRSHRQLAALSSASTGNRRKAPAVYPHSATVGRVQMTNHLLAGVAAVVLMSGVSSAQTYPPAPPPPVGPPPIPGAPPAPLPGPSTSTTTTVAPTPDGGYRSSTTQLASMNTGAQSPKRISTSKASRAARRPTRRRRPTSRARARPRSRRPQPRPGSRWTARNASVVSRAKVCNYSWRGRGGICRAARPRLTLRMSALFDLPSAAPRMIRARNAMRCSVLPDRTSRSSSCLASRVTANAALLAHMLASLTRATRILKHCVRHYTRCVLKARTQTHHQERRRCRHPIQRGRH